MRVKKYISWFVQDTGMVIVNTNTEKCLVLNSSSTEIWDRITKGYEKDAIISELKNKYPDCASISHDVEEVIIFFVNNDLLEED